MTAALQVRTVERLCHDREGLRAAYLTAQVLIERRWHEYPAPSWDEPAVLVFAGGECVAGINFRDDASELATIVSFAWCSPAHPAALVVCLAAFRKRLKAAPRDVRFSCHPDNGPMMKLAKTLGLVPRSVSFRVPAESLAR